MKTKNLAEKVPVVPGESTGIWVAIAKLMRRRSVIDIVERFQTKHALQEERETKEFPAVDERRGRSGHYPFNTMNSKASTQRKSKSMEKK